MFLSASATLGSMWSGLSFPGSLIDLWSQLAQSMVDFNYSLQQHSSLELLMFGTQLESDGSSYAFLCCCALLCHKVAVGSLLVWI